MNVSAPTTLSQFYVLCLFVVLLSACSKNSQETYFPPPDSEGGWRSLNNPESILVRTGMEIAKVDEAFELAKASTKNGGLLVVRDGWLVYEKYFGLGHRESLCNLASIGKSFTSIAAGILMDRHPSRFSDGLDQKIYHPDYLPSVAFPPTDPDKLEISLGQFLAFTGGIRGNNPSYVNGVSWQINPLGLDGWPGMVDEYVVGRKDYERNGTVYTAKTLWTQPGGGYSYATASIHLVSMMVRHLSGMEMDLYLRQRLSGPIGFGRFGFGYRHVDEVVHTTGGGGVVARPTDMLRFGYLLLNRGEWDGRQIVPSAYVDHCRQASPYNPHYPYSLQFNVNTGGRNPNVPRDAFWKYGSGGHALFVVPSLNLVIWKLGGRDSQYDPQNTGFERHSEAPAVAADRSGWKASIAIEPANIRIFNRVVSSVKTGE